jgi:hypothetical protein
MRMALWCGVTRRPGCSRSVYSNAELARLESSRRGPRARVFERERKPASDRRACVLKRGYAAERPHEPGRQRDAPPPRNSGAGAGVERQRGAEDAVTLPRLREAGAGGEVL